MGNTSIKVKLITLVIGSILVTSVAIFVETMMALNNTSKVITTEFEKEAYKLKENELKNNVQIAIKTIESFYKKAQDDPKNMELHKKRCSRGYIKYQIWY